MPKIILILAIIISCIFVWAREETNYATMQNQTSYSTLQNRFGDDKRITSDYAHHDCVVIDSDGQTDIAYCAFRGDTIIPTLFVYKTTDGGHNWTYFSQYTFMTAPWITDIVVTTSRVCVSYGRFEPSVNGYIIGTYSIPKTGGTASVHEFPQVMALDPQIAKKEGSDHIDIAFIFWYGSSSYERCVVYYNSFDGGVSWSNEHSFALDEYHVSPDICHLFNTNEVYITWRAVLPNVIKFAKSTNNGGNFTTQDTPYTGGYPRISANDTYILIFASDMCIWSNNGGVSWGQFTIPVNNVRCVCYGYDQFRAVACPSPNYNTIMYQSAATPSGFASSWEQINDVSNITATRWPFVCVVPSCGGLAVWSDDRAGVYHAYCDGEDWVGIQEERLTNKLFNDFFLDQNYPNPMSLSTKIKYSLPKTCKIKLGLFDATGREVAVLVNEIQQAGHYQVIWNIRKLSRKQLSNGIYFYQLKTDDFTKTRKMIILR